MLCDRLLQNLDPVPVVNYGRTPEITQVLIGLGRIPVIYHTHDEHSKNTPNRFSGQSPLCGASNTQASPCSKGVVSPTAS